MTPLVHWLRGRDPAYIACGRSIEGLFFYSDYRHPKWRRLREIPAHQTEFFMRNSHITCWKCLELKNHDEILNKHTSTPQDESEVK